MIINNSSRKKVRFKSLDEESIGSKNDSKLSCEKQEPTIKKIIL